MTRADVVRSKLYAGLWIASVRGRVVASGRSAQETLLHCRAMRLKDEPILRYSPAVKPQNSGAGRRQTKTKTKNDDA